MSRSCTLLTDGSSDRALLYPLQWLVEQNSDVSFHFQWADLRGLPHPPTSLSERIRTAVEYFPADLLFVHRDAERESSERRRDEILEAVAGIALPPFVMVVPVRMQEAWFLFDEVAIREAAGNPRGRASLGIGDPRQAEALADPKSVLHEALITACGLEGRRRRLFRPEVAAHRLAELIEDYGPLRELPAFRWLEDDLRRCFSRTGWGAGGC